MAVSSYLPDAAGGVVVGGAFAHDATAGAGIDLLGSSGIRSQDISVIASDRRLAERIAGDRAWTPSRNGGGLPVIGWVFGSDLPGQVRRRYGGVLRSGGIVVLVAAGDQPPDTIAALLVQAEADRIEQWWQEPTDLFAPPELAGPF